MLKWKLLAVLGLAFGVAGIGWGYAQQQTFPGFYELRIYKAQPKGVQTTVKTTWADRMTTTVEYPANYDGKDYPVEGSRDVDAVVLSRMDDFTSAATLKHAGKEIGVARRVVSPDGKTMTISYKGINTRGDLVDNVAVYDRQ